MNCPTCGASKSKVRLTYRYAEENQRYRECRNCGERWTTVELLGNVKIRRGDVVGVSLHGHSVERKL